MESIEISEEPIAYQCSSEVELSELVNCSIKLSCKTGFLLLLKDKQSFLKRLVPSYLNANLRFKEKNAKAKSISMEMLLFIAGTLRTEKAIAECGAIDNKSFMVFATSKQVFTKFSKAVKLKVLKEYKLELDLDSASDVAQLAFAED